MSIIHLSDSLSCTLCLVGSSLLPPPALPSPISSAPVLPKVTDALATSGQKHIDASEDTCSVSVKICVFMERVYLNSVWSILLRNVCDYFLDGSLKAFQLSFFYQVVMQRPRGKDVHLEIHRADIW